MMGRSQAFLYMSHVSTQQSLFFHPRGALSRNPSTSLTNPTISPLQAPLGGQGWHPQPAEEYH